MTIFQALVSGVVQGITEFFPISSSGHLVILHQAFGVKEPQLAFDIFLHLGTLASILIFFRKDILNLFGKDKKVLGLLILGSMPTLVIGLLFKDVVEAFFGMPKVVGWMLILTGIWLTVGSLYSKYLKRVGKRRTLGLANSIIIGIAQGISVMPGISRSGATIATGLLLGLDEDAAFKFSFLMAMPAIFGANLLKAGKISSSLLGPDALHFAIGGITAMLVGIAAIGALLKLIKRELFIIFGIYCLLAGAFVVISIR